MTTVSGSDPIVGVEGTSTGGPGTAGLYGAGVQGVSTGNSTGIGVDGLCDSGPGSTGVRGRSYSGTGVRGESESGTGVSGVSYYDEGVSGVSYYDEGVSGVSYYDVGVFGYSNSGAGVFGESISTFSVGVQGSNMSGVGVEGSSNSGVGVAGYSNSFDGVFGYSSSGHAGYFFGNVHVAGTLTKTTLAFKIDHPLDPANKYLFHSGVESPDMKNLYDGVAVLDVQGETIVELPLWFEALNQEFRYQLTPIGVAGPNLYIAEEISDRRFKIAGGTPGMKVCWQVTGNRKDAYAQANPLVVEQEKSATERGRYMHPEVHGHSREQSIAWVHHPEVPRRDVEERQKTRED
jgi:hypothetical protein